MDKTLILNEVKKHYGFKNDTEFARFLGINSQNIRNWYNRNNYNANLLIEKCVEFNAEYIITGEGPMLKAENMPIINYKRGVPYYNVDFLGGFDVVVNDQTIRPQFLIDFKPYNNADCWCNISGRSMEPEISHGDVLALKEIKNWRTYLPYGETYGIVTDNNIRTVKKVRAGSDKDHVRLVPNNTKEFDEQEIEISSILKVYQVLVCVKRIT